ncbi:DUF3817 domain-containing protein [Microbacterium album]|uniref:DUF3817 domain-containing protein n=1 Tax=Microbacterium album TaxID=2053191 RepID=UPI00166C0503|nr:DUF3817 domain-containing protein [Microbacterium album]
MFHRPASLFRVFAIAEAISWTLLIGGMVLRAITGERLGVTIGGAIHGFVFLAFCAVVVIVAKNQRWPAGVWILALVSAILPYATIPAEIRLHRTGRLAGEWRVEPTDDPRDAAWHDRALRLLLRRPVQAGATAAVAVVAVFAALLLIGPPGGSH